MSNRADLEKSWATTGGHLKAARELLHDEGPAGAYGASLAGFEQCLSQNEMELALDELEDLGLTSAPPAEFWRHLMYAANNMALADRAAEYRRRMDAA